MKLFGKKKEEKEVHVSLEMSEEEVKGKLEALQDNGAKSKEEVSEIVTAWADQKLKDIEDEQDPLKRYRLICLLRQNPKTLLCPKETLNRMTASWKKLFAESPDAAKEWKAQLLYKQNLLKEMSWTDSRTRTLKDLKMVYAQYEKTARAYQKTRTAVARVDSQRSALDQHDFRTIKMVVDSIEVCVQTTGGFRPMVQ